MGKTVEIDDDLISILGEWLGDEMSDISEDHYAADWMVDLEFDLWGAVQRLPEKTDYGCGVIPAERLQRLKKVSDAVNGWYDGDDLVTMDCWLEMVAARNAELSRNNK